MRAPQAPICGTDDPLCWVPRETENPRTAPGRPGVSGAQVEGRSEVTYLYLPTLLIGPVEALSKREGWVVRRESIAGRELSQGCGCRRRQPCRR